MPQPLALPRALPSPRQEAALREVLGLLRPRAQSVRNSYRRLTRGGRIRLSVFVVVGLGFGAAIFFFFHRALTYFLSVPELGPVLTYKLLGMIFVTFFSILLFSNIVTSLSSFFLSRELDRLVAAPVSARRFFYARFAETLMDSSWMMLLFAAPAFLAYGIVHHTGLTFYLMTALTLPPFLVIPGALGVIVTTVLVNVFPARRTKDILLLLSVLMVAVLYLLFRMLRPERLVNPQGFSDFAAFLSAMQTPEYTFLPSTWATEVLFPLLGLRTGRPWFFYGLLATTAAVSAMAAEAVVCRMFLAGWSKAQEGRQVRLTRRPAWERLLALVTAVFPRQTRLIIAKEVKTFFRDTSQWSQLILLLALVVVYVYNFSVLPIRGSPLVTFYFKNVIAFLNLALAAFVTAAVAARFVFPSISLEGRAFWILKTAPLRLRRLWWAKFWVGLVPLLILGEVLVLATNSYLNVIPFMVWLSAVTLAGMVFVIVALALALGAAYPRFDADNAAHIAAGSGGLIFMILAMSFVGAVVILEAWPVYALFMSRLNDMPLSRQSAAGITLSFAAVLVINVATFFVSTRYGMQRLEKLEP